MNDTKILELLKKHNIDYNIQGKNIGKKAIASINCPFCGDDTGKHLGIIKNNNSYYYHCWRNSRHKGSLAYLLSKLFHITFEEVKILLKNNYCDDDFFLDIEKEKCYNNSYVREKTLQMTFKSLNKDAATAKMFINYLRNRGFIYLDKIVQHYDIRYCNHGDWNWRLIFPMYLNKNLITWQGRDITNMQLLRYRDLSIDESIRHVKDFIYDYDNLKGGKYLFVCEGIFDVLKLKYLLEDKIDATCVFTTSIRDSQIDLVTSIANAYDYIFVMLDRNAEVSAMMIKEQLSHLKNVYSLSIEQFDVKDPGEFDEITIKKLTTYLNAI